METNAVRSQQRVAGFAQNNNEFCGLAEHPVVQIGKDCLAEERFDADEAIQSYRPHAAEIVIAKMLSMVDSRASYKELALQLETMANSIEAADNPNYE